MSDAPIYVLDDKKRRALHKVESLIDGLGKNGDPVPASAYQTSIEVALLDEYDTDAHAVSYHVSVPEGFTEVPRLSKLSLPQIRELGGDVHCSVVFLDIDLKDIIGRDVDWMTLPEDQRDELWSKFTSVVPGLPAPYCVYATRGGAHVVLLLAQDVRAGAAYEAVLARVHNFYHAAGIPVDKACKDWTRVYRLPRVIRDGLATWEQPYWRFQIADEPDFYLPEQEDMDREDGVRVSGVEFDDVGDHPSDEEAHVLIYDDRGHHTPQAKKVLGRFGKSRWLPFLKGESIIEQGARDTTLAKLAGALARTGIETELGYAFLLVQAKEMDHEQDENWREKAWDLMCRFTNSEKAKKPKKDVLPERYQKNAAGVEVEEEQEIDVEEPDKLELQEELLTNDQGRPLQTLGNLHWAMNDLGIRVFFNVFSGRHHVEGIRGFGPILDNAILRKVYQLLEMHYSLTLSEEKISQWLRTIGDHNRFHPVREYLEKLEWDGKPRVLRWLSKYADAPYDEYTREISAVSLVACIRRVMDPGCKHDTMLLLEGPQGSSKSTAIQMLAKHQDWFGDTVVLGDDGKRTIEGTAGKWIIEAAEVVGLRKGDTDKLKGFLSRRVDEGRPAYAREVVRHPRQFVLFGTTNHDKYLNDDTGNRRFWPVRVSTFDLEALERDVDQLWAEALHMYREGQHFFMDPSLYKVAAEQQQDRETVFDDPLFEKVASLFAKVDEGLISVTDLNNGLNIETPNDGKRVKQAMSKLGWERTTRSWRKGKAETRYECQKRGNGKVVLVILK